MTTVVLFPSVLGVRRGVLDAAQRIREDGHAVLVADLYEGRTFDDYAPAIAFAEQDLGQALLMKRALEAVERLPDGFLAAGFSLGCAMAAYVATQRPVSGVLMIAGAIPVSAFEAGDEWPAGVPAQTHSMLDDPWREQDMLDLAIVEIEAAGADIEVFDYPGRGHLFTDPSLPAEYDASATAVLWSRALPFIRSGCAWDGGRTGPSFTG